MRIMHLLQSDKYSGAESVVCQIIDLFHSDSDMEMVYVSPDGPIRLTLEERGIPFFALKDFSQKSVNHAIKTLKPDIIHAHDFNASVRSVMRRNVKIVSHLHNNPKWLPRICLYSLVFYYAIRRVEIVIGVSDSIVREFVFRKRLASKYICLPNVVNAESIITKSNEERMPQIDVLFVGRLSEPKNPLGFLSIVREIQQRLNKSSNVLMIGVGPLREKCLQYIRENKLEGSVRMIGFEKNPYKYIKAAKMVIMPSVYEGFGLVAVESMVVGTVVLASPVGGLVDILGGGCGFLCNTTNEFANIAISILTGSINCDGVIEKAKHKAMTFSNVSSYKQKLKGIYESMREKLHE